MLNDIWRYIMFHSPRSHVHTFVHTRVAAEWSIFCATML